MNKKSAHVKPKREPSPSTPKPRKETGLLDPVLLIRLVAATVVFAISLITKMSSLVSALLLALSAVIAGYDIILTAVKSFEDKDYFATSVVVIFVAVVSFIIGFPSEGAALILLYQIGLLLIAYTGDRTKRSAMELLRYQDVETVGKVSELLKDENAASMEIGATMRDSSSSILKLAMVFAVVYAVALPVFTSFSFTVSIHRALMIILIATPMSVVAAMPFTGIVGICYSAQQGVVYNNAATLEKISKINTAVFDKAGIFSEADPHVLSMQSDIVEQSTFLDFAAHSVYYSEQPIAKALSALYNQEYKLSVISDFVDIPGCGVQLKIGDVPVVLATSDVFIERGVQIPLDQDEAGQVFYMTLSDRYIGKIVISSDINSELAELAPAMKEAGIRRCMLLTEDGKGESQRIAETLGFDEVYGECNTSKKLQLISDLAEGARNRILYIYSSGIEAHSAAEIDVRVSRKAKFADGIALPQYVMNIPFSIQVSRRMREVATENAVFAFVIKAILIFLSIVGYCNVWFAIFIDMVAAVATILNSIRVTNESLLDTLKYKTGR